MTLHSPLPVIPAEAGISLGAKRLHFTEILPWGSLCGRAESGMTGKRGDIYIELTLINKLKYKRLVESFEIIWVH